MMYKAFLVKYAEIGIKGKNRHLFEKALCVQMDGGTFCSPAIVRRS